MKRHLIYILSFFTLFAFSCNQGLAPGEEASGETGFGGTITFTGNWPASVKQTYLVLFKDELHDSTDFIVSNIYFISEEIPFGINQFRYSTLENQLDPQLFGKVPPGEYAYLAVVQSESETIQLIRSAWVVAGVYYSGNDFSAPGKIIVDENKFTDNININVDFSSPPPQPPQKFPPDEK